MRYAILILLGIVMLAACAKEETPVYRQQNYSVAPEPEMAVKCLIWNTTYYSKSFYIYHVNDNAAKFVYSPIGTYTKPKGNTRWQLRI